MENQNPPISEQNIPVEQLQPVSNPIIPAIGAPKSKFPLALVIGIILFSLVAGSAAGFFVFKPQIEKLVAKPTPTPKPGCFYQKVQCIQAPCPPVLVCPSTISPTPNPTASWKTYTNTAFGWSIKYPQSLEAFDSKLNDQSVLYLDTPEVASIFKSKPIYEGPMKISISTARDTMPTSFPYTNGSSSNPTIKTVSINGYTGIRGQETSTMGLVDQVFLQNPKGGYIDIQFDGVQDADQILSTLKFTDLSTTPTPICMQRPACLDATPRCLIAEPANGWCPANQTCNSDADCASGSSCMTSGPLVAGQAVHKICVQKGSAVPL